jgi:hypothetical protein
MGIAEEGLHREFVQRLVACEFASIVERNGLSQWWRNWLEQPDQMSRHPLGDSVTRSGRKNDPRLPFMDGQDGLAVF